MKKIISLLLTTMMVFSLTACSGNSSNENDSGATPANAGANNSEKMKIYFITKILGNQYWSVVEQGAKDAAKELDVDLTVNGVANESEVEKQVELLQNAVSAKAAAICIGPVDSTAMANPVSDAFKSGIPIVIVDTMINTDDYTVALMTNNVEAGKSAAQEMIKKMKAKSISETEEADIAIQIGSSGSQTIIDRLKGFNEYWDANAPKAWKVLNNDVKVNDGDITKAVGFTQDFLTTYPKLKAVFGPNNGSTVGFVTGLKEADRTDIVLIGFDFSKEIEQMINEDKFTVSTIVQKQYLMGYDGVKDAVKAAKGEKIDQKLVDTGVMLVDKSNITDPEVVKVINPSK